MLRLIISGGQSGVDRGALDAAIALDFPHGGWCPQDRLAEDGTIAECYQLTETLSKQYRVRTRLNVQDSDATLIITRGSVSGGTALTEQIALQLGKPCFVIDLNQWSKSALRSKKAFRPVLDWLHQYQVKSLNVAGPRESNNPGIQKETQHLISVLLKYALK